VRLVCHFAKKLHAHPSDFPPNLVRIHGQEVVELELLMVIFLHIFAL
jgi:hypothetical protein